MRRAIILAVFLALGAVVLLAPWPMFSPAGGEREVLVRARQYAYDPGVIRVPKGARVTLVLESEDVTHGLYLDGYDIDLATAPGRRVRTSFVADRPGMFRMRCSKVCGTLHPFMLGELVVEPNTPLWRSVALALLAAAGAVTYLAVGRRGTRGREAA
jgi:cytochrome c oxidase subunit 2